MTLTVQGVPVIDISSDDTGNNTGNDTDNLAKKVCDELFPTSSDEDFAIYRRFSYLQARLLLDKQDQLRLLEEQLDHYDTSDLMRSTRKGLTPEQYAPRAKLLGEIEAVFTSYGAWKLSITLTRS